MANICGSSRFVAAVAVVQLSIFPALSVAQQCYPNLPTPQLAIVGSEHYTANGQPWTRFSLNVTNHDAFPDALFAPAPTLPPCGLNTNSSRTWVSIFDDADRYVYGFCGLQQSENLNQMWFAIARGTPPPPAVYVTLNDRQCGLTYRSNLVATAISPPTLLTVSSIVGNLVTFRWSGPASGPQPTEYILEGGLNPGELLASLPTGSPFPIYTVAVPNGSFYVRMHAASGVLRSAASNEIRIHVNVPVPPSAPANLLGLVDGSTLALAWRNTYAGAAPTSLVLDVSGSIVASLPLGFSDAFSFVGVPGGTYTLALRAQNAGGTSPPSNAVTLAFPGLCSGPPLPPADVLAYRRGSTVSVEWAPWTSGPAPTAYMLNVTGSFVGSIPTSRRTMSGTVGPGSYNLSVVATNPCGASASTPPQTIAVP